MTSRIYLDNNATTRPFPEVIEAMAHHGYHSFANPGSRHSAGRQARKALEDARESIADILGAKPQEIVFTSGGTESTNLALFGLTQTAPGTILLTDGEHPATSESCRRLNVLGWQIHKLPVDSTGRLDQTHLETLDWREVKLATLIWAHNETGVIQELGPLAAKCTEQQVPLHIDAVQCVGKIPISFRESGATTLALGAHKFHGPRGIGALLIREGTTLAAHVFGGHQEGGRRAGTEPVALIVGMARALEIWNAERQQTMQRLQLMRDQLQARLLEHCPPAVVNGDGAPRLPNTLNIAFPGTDGDAVLVALDLEGVACSLGSTCASGSAEPAPALVAMGCSPAVYESSVRFSLSVDNTEREIDEAASRITTVVNRLRGNPTP